MEEANMTASRFVGRLVPAGVRKLARDFAGVTALQGRIDRLETFLHESRDDTWERSRRRWRATSPTADLTWGAVSTGDAFIAKAASYQVFHSTKAILEIGPGYGRLLKSILAKRIPFKRYLGVDISAANVAFLKQNLGSDKVDFIEGDVEKIILENKFDILISSLVFKHLYPSFASALQNVVPFLNTDAILVFDLIQGDRTFFESDNVTYVRQYTKEEVLELLAQADLELVAFDEVQHEESKIRLLVVSRRAPAGPPLTMTLNKE
jgi:SAM-dependent methyltransferase